MNAFVIELEDRPGEMARVTEQLAARGVNILIYGITTGSRGAIGFVAGDEAAARAALGETGVIAREVPVVHVRMEDRPGEAARISRQLADAGVNIVLWLPVDTSQGSFTVAIGVDDVEAARQALGEQPTDFRYA